MPSFTSELDAVGADVFISDHQLDPVADEFDIYDASLITGHAPEHNQCVLWHYSIFSFSELKYYNGIPAVSPPVQHSTLFQQQAAPRITLSTMAPL